MNNILYILLLLASVLAAQTSVTPAAGDGSEGNPYQIATLENLYWLSQTPSVWGGGTYFVQTADIDASATKNWDNGAGFKPIGYFNSYSDYHYFAGHYNGRGHKIDGLTILRPSTDYVGLFGYLDRASIDSLGLANVSVEGNSYVGGVSGYNNYSSVEYCSVTGTVKGNASDVGAIIGKANNGASVDYSFATASVSGISNVGGLVGQSYYDSDIRHSYAEVAVAGTTNVGGLVGLNVGSVIINSYAAGSVEGQDTVGGLVGKFSCNTIQFSYSSGKVSGNTLVGGIIGYSNGCDIEDSYYNNESSGQNTGISFDEDNQSVTGLTTPQMMKQSSFADWDFTNTWVIYDGHTMPLLRTFLKPLVISAADTAKVYDGKAFVGGKMAFDLADVDESLVLGVPVSSAEGTINAGDYAYTIGSGLYSTQQGYLISYGKGSANLIITPAPLTVKADASTKTYGEADPALSYTVTGLVNSDTKAVLSGSLARQAGESVGKYAIGQGTLAAANYTLSYTGDYLSITPAPLTVKADAMTKTYGSADPALSYTVTGLVNSDTKAVLSGSLSRAAGESVGKYAIGQGSLAAANYSLTYTGADLSITPAPLTVSAAASTKTYGSADPALNYTVTGLVNSDTKAVLSGSLARQAGESVGKYAIGQGTLSAANYSLTYTGADLSITPALLTIGVGDVKQTLGEPLPTEFEFSYEGWVNEEDETLVSGLAATYSCGECKEAGVYDIILSGALASNYEIAYVNGLLTLESPLSIGHRRAYRPSLGKAPAWDLLGRVR